MFSFWKKNKNVVTEHVSVEKVQLREIDLSNAKKLGTDLLEAGYVLSCCEQCAKYRGRWFSISGRDRNFPKLPNLYECECFGLIFHPVIAGISEPGVETWFKKKVNIIKYSNRPYVDDRSEEEKENLRKYIEQKKYKEQLEKDKKEYAQICSLIPDCAPKSVSAYRKMKGNNTEEFRGLVEKAKNKGIIIE